ncbi:MAG: NAD+ synthase [Nitrososphaerota archaeon]
MSNNFLVKDYSKVTNRITDFILCQVTSSKKKGVVIGLSGGIDSSVCAVLACRALGNRRTFSLFMPERGLTTRTDIHNVNYLVRSLKITIREIQINGGKKILLKSLPKQRLAGGNFSARLRMALLYYFAATHNLLVLGTADKSELMLGYFTKFGDAGADIFPIGELYKSQAKLLARHLELPEEIIQQKSSPRFWKGQLAEKEIGLPYHEIDRILESYVRNDLKNSDISKSKIKLVTDMIKKTQHKKEHIPICNPF